MPDIEPEKTVGRTTDGRFGAGNPGRPRGSRNKVNRETLDAISNLRGKALQALSEQLDQGNIRAAMWVLDRFTPSERVVEMDDSELTPSEQNKLALAAKQLSEIDHIAAVSERLSELEAIISGAKH